MQKRISLTLSAFMICFNAYSSVTLPADGHFDIWPTIPFIRGADLCGYSDAYGQSRTTFMNKMVQSAGELMGGGASGGQALALLTTFNSLYDQNKALASRYQYIDVTLESTLKSYLDSFYREINPRSKRIGYTNVNDILVLVEAAKNGTRDGYLDDSLLAQLDFISYGTYSFAPTCSGEILVTYHMIGRDGKSESFVATGKPEFVMSDIASQIIAQYQKTQFPSLLKIGNKSVTIIGGLNGSVDRITSPEMAEEACSTLNARLPNQLELEILNGYGDWSGGVSFNGKTWAMPNGKIYVSDMFPPVRNTDEVNDREFYYFCLQ